MLWQSIKRVADSSVDEDDRDDVLGACFGAMHVHERLSVLKRAYFPTTRGSPRLVSGPVRVPTRTSRPHTVHYILKHPTKGRPLSPLRVVVIATPRMYTT